MSKEISFEVMAIGTWNGLEFSKKRLQSIVDNFKKLKDVHKPYIKLGHNPEQEMADGMPAMGWVDEVWLTPLNKLMVKVIDMPEVLFEAIKKKFYKRVSVELDMDVTYKSENIGDVLTAVAILGADVPAVNTLEDLQAFMSASTITGQQKLVFTAIETDYKPTTNEEPDMGDELKAVNDKLDKLMSRLDSVETENTALKAANAILKTQTETFAAEKATQEAADKKTAVTLARKTVTDILEAGVKGKHITPAQREDFCTMLQIADDDAVQRVNIDLLTKMVGKGSASFTTTETAASSGGTTDEGAGEVTPDEKVTLESQKLVNEGKAKDLFTAQKMVFAADPKLAREYVDFNEVN